MGERKIIKKVILPVATAVGLFLSSMSGATAATTSKTNNTITTKPNSITTKATIENGVIKNAELAKCIKKSLWDIHKIKVNGPLTQDDLDKLMSLYIDNPGPTIDLSEVYKLTNIIGITIKNCKTIKNLDIENYPPSCNSIEVENSNIENVDSFYRSGLVIESRFTNCPNLIINWNSFSDTRINSNNSIFGHQGTFMTYRTPKIYQEWNKINLCTNNTKLRQLILVNKDLNIKDKLTVGNAYNDGKIVITFSKEVFSKIGVTKPDEKEKLFLDALKQTDGSFVFVDSTDKDINVVKLIESGKITKNAKVTIYLPEEMWLLKYKNRWGKISEISDYNIYTGIETMKQARLQEVIKLEYLGNILESVMKNCPDEMHYARTIAYIAQLDRETSLQNLEYIAGRNEASEKEIIAAKKDIDDGARENVMELYEEVKYKPIRNKNGEIEFEVDGKKLICDPAKDKYEIKGLRGELDSAIQVQEIDSDILTYAKKDLENFFYNGEEDFLSRKVDEEMYLYYTSSVLDPKSKKINKVKPSFEKAEKYWENRLITPMWINGVGYPNQKKEEVISISDDEEYSTSEESSLQDDINLK